jgi:hypothetical protein
MTPNGATLDFAFLSSTKQPRIMRSHHVLRGNFSNRAASARSAQGLDLSRMRQPVRAAACRAQCPSRTDRREPKTVT